MEFCLVKFWYFEIFSNFSIRLKNMNSAVICYCFYDTNLFLCYGSMDNYYNYFPVRCNKALSFLCFD